MRAGIVVAGVVVLVIGLVLAFVPLVNQGSTHVGQFQSLAEGPSGFSITGSIPVSITWSAATSGSLSVAVSSCSPSSASAGTCNGPYTWHNQSGTSGSESFSIPDGGSAIFAFSSLGGASVTMTTALSTIGAILLVIGIIVLIVGLVLRRKQPKPSAVPPAAPVA